MFQQTAFSILSVNQPTRFVGIDVGLKGAISVVDLAPGEAPKVDCFDLPVIETRTKKAKGRNILDPVSLIRLLGETKLVELTKGVPVYATYEVVSAAPGQGVSSMFNFGRSLGTVETALAAVGYTTTAVTPSEWKKALKVPAAKDGAVLKADQLLPGARNLWRGPRGGLIDGRAEATLIALYGVVAPAFKMVNC